MKALSDGLRIDLVDTPLRVTNIKPGMVETNFTVVRYRGDKEAADNFYKGIRPLTGDDIAETVYFAASAPAHIQIAEVLLMPTYQATGTISYKKSRNRRFFDGFLCRMIKFLLFCCPKLNIIDENIELLIKTEYRIMKN